MSDIGAFTEKSEVTITHRSSGDLKVVLQEKLQKLLAHEVEEVTPKKLAAELGEEAEPESDVDAELDALARARAEKTAETKEKTTE